MWHAVGGVEDLDCTGEAGEVVDGCVGEGSGGVRLVGDRRRDGRTHSASN